MKQDLHFTSEMEVLLHHITAVDSNYLKNRGSAPEGYAASFLKTFPMRSFSLPGRVGAESSTFDTYLVGRAISPALGASPS
jgi:hypothetical protein